ncbi:MAG TPA: hypothetical protein ENH91_02240 [Leeuwenhoekiella sp.]|nr:hypothetical protein [Leeuwenhoekiella sp.]
MAVNYIEYKKAELRSNCPECFSTDGLVIIFAYRNEKNKLFERSTSEVQSTMYCTNCDTVIYPSRWTDDIERVFAYNKKLAQPPAPYFKFKPLSLILLLAIIAVGITVAFLIMRF